MSSNFPASPIHNTDLVTGPATLDIDSPHLAWRHLNLEKMKEVNQKALLMKSQPNIHNFPSKERGALSNRKSDLAAYRRQIAPPKFKFDPTSFQKNITHVK